MIIEAWMSGDHEVNEAIQVDLRIEKLLKKIYQKNGYPEIGSYRPDFVMNEESPKFTEINARFCLNGYIITYLGAHIDFLKKTDFPLMS